MAPAPPARGRQGGLPAAASERLLSSLGFLGSQLDPLPPTPALLCASSSDSLQGAIREGNPPASPDDGRPGPRGSLIKVALGPGSGLPFRRATKWKMVPGCHKDTSTKFSGPFQMATGEFSEEAAPPLGHPFSDEMSTIEKIKGVSQNKVGRPLSQNRPECVQTCRFLSLLPDPLDQNSWGR